MKAPNSLFSCSACCKRLFRPWTTPPIPSPSRRTYTRPSTAPKISIDIKHIRQNPGLYEQNCNDRNYRAQAKNSWKITELHEQWLSCQREARGLRERNNVLRRKLANAASRSDDAEAGVPGSEDAQKLLDEAKTLKSALSTIELKEKALQTQLEDLALELPNLSSLHTPPGDIPAVVDYVNDHPDPAPSSSGPVWRSHVHIGTELDLLDFASAGTASGWGWYYLKNEAALLEQALIQYTFQVAMARGWEIVSPPSLVYAHMAAACGFQPRDQNGEQQIYAIEQGHKDKERGKPSHVLAGTAEIPLAAMKADTVLEESELPLKVIGASRCYRAEAGARGVDTKGLYRVHEFTKVEMFGWTIPPLSPYSPISSPNFTSPAPRLPSEELFNEILKIQTYVLQSLGLHCRILEMPSTDLGASASRKRDIEVFFPSRREKDDGWGEVTSTSNCLDFQTRRLATRVRVESEGRRLHFPHTVNGTAMAVPRVLAAILENGWMEEEKCVIIPPVLRPWMGGRVSIQRGNGGGRSLSGEMERPVRDK